MPCCGNPLINVSNDVDNNLPFVWTNVSDTDLVVVSSVV